MDFLKKVVKLLLLAIIFYNSVGFSMAEPNLKDPIGYNGYVSEVVQSFIEEVIRDYGIYPSGNGGCFAYDVESITLFFTVNRQTSLDEARILIIDLTEKFKKAIDSHEKIRPFLREYPVSSEIASISLWFEDIKTGEDFEGGVASVSTAREMLHFKKSNPNGVRLIDLKKEPYQEALDIVNKGKSI